MQPTLSWRVGGPATTRQSGFRIVVASSPRALASGRADLWDSGHLKGGSVAVRYDGAPLKAGKAYHWKVQIFDENGTSAWSSPSSWETGLLDPSDWTGKWIAVESADERTDRLASPVWVEGSSPSPEHPRSFRLPFRSTGGEGMFTIVADGAISSLALDGKPLDLPHRDPNAFGGAPAARIKFPAPAGEHVLAVDIAPIAGFFIKPAVAVAAQLRLDEATGVRRITTGWQTRLGTESLWSEALPAAFQPVFPWPPAPGRLLRRTFVETGNAIRARLHVAALGGYRLWLNGVRIGDDELQSEPADYSRRIPCRTYDVTALVRDGENVLGALVGDGFFASYQAPEGRYAYGAAPRRIRLVLEIEAADGQAHRIVTDPEWRHTDSPLRMSEIYAGEDQDLRLWPEGWLSAGFDASGWAPAWEAPLPEAPCSPAIAEPVRVVREMPPIAVRRIGDRRFIVDFGQNFAGRVRLRAAGAAGQQITVRHAEVLDPKGELDRSNLRAARAEDRYILRGRPGSEDLEPILTYQGFRYAEIEGLPDLDAGAVTGLVLSSALHETGTLRIDNGRLQRLWLNTLWSQRSNFVGVPTDCPQRDERLGWTGDAQVFWDAAAFNMDVTAFTRSYCRILRDVQGKDGAYPLWAPSPSGLGWGTTSATPGWADAGVMLPYTAFLHSGDAAIVDENWEAMTAYIEGILARNPDALWTNGRGADLGDWLALDAKFPMDETTPKALIATAMLARSAEQLAKMADWTGRSAAASHWRGQHDRIRQAFQNAFVKPDGSVGNGSQCGYIMALGLGLLDTGRQKAAGRRLASDIRRRGTLLSTGFLGTPLALDALASVNENELVWDLLLRREYPSWGYMVDHGATTIWERWNGDTGDVAMNSFNHYALGAVAAFLYRRIAGIEPVEPGFARFKVAILPDQRVGSAGASVNTARGRIETHWTCTATRTALDLTVPTGSVAEVELPTGKTSAGPGSHRFTF
ncbi:family 78 glycoside hydrolase catalytic domain (plasmid) [Novosphingobium resinovorum]|uniref:alpha-L-rhamnosidase n=1 Tax=Novosphingobium resinovorum TaxID=158500 RepID=UPI0020034141|nr:alpha-L-rhamnosidase [Novosphingobium resinovorum]WJM29987.1 family 78 glycoside hydrolase catalytic domain [Novosphingobium resinovorum]